jgi:hypothetical protein
MPSHILLLGHARLGQFGSSVPPVRVVDCDQSRPALHCIAAGGWSSSYARTRDGDVYSLQAAAYRLVPLQLPRSGTHQAVAVDLPKASRVALPDGEQCIGWVRVDRSSTCARVSLCHTADMCTRVC